MAESSNSGRVKFKKGEQSSFIIECQENLKLNNKDLAKALNVSVRTLSDWKKEKFLISFSSVKFLSKKSGVTLPKNIEILKPYWYVKKGAKRGGYNMYKKYGRVGGDPDYRKQKWREWWEREGKLKPGNISNNPLPFKKADYSAELAEFTGIMIGDGGMNKYQISITLHSKDDMEYSEFVIKLINKLFNVTPSVYNSAKDLAKDIVISRTGLVNFLANEIGLKIGNKIKQAVDIPGWVMSNSDFKIACMRGLMDTDGSVVIHKYRVNNKLYRYKKLDFCSASSPLIKSVIKILEEFDFQPRLSNNGRNVLIDNQKEVARYLKIIGSNNPKHWQRYKS